MLGPLLIRIHLLFTHPSEWIFLREFVGKEVVCRFDDRLLIEGILRKDGSYYLDLDTGVEPKEKCLLFLDNMTSVLLQSTDAQGGHTETTDADTEITNLVDNHSQTLNYLDI
ncbi:unnamed protein product [Caenorhabditis brenneri]